VILEITGSRRSLSDPDPKMAGERGLGSANRFVNGPSPERAATRTMLQKRSKGERAAHSQIRAKLTLRSIYSPAPRSKPPHQHLSAGRRSAANFPASYGINGAEGSVRKTRLWGAHSRAALQGSSVHPLLLNRAITGLWMALVRRPKREFWLAAWTASPSPVTSKSRLFRRPRSSRARPGPLEPAAARKRPPPGRLRFSRNSPPTVSKWAMRVSWITARFFRPQYTVSIRRKVPSQAVAYSAAIVAAHLGRDG